MNNISDILQSVVIGLAVATFLLNTGRGLKAIEVCEECLIFLNNEALKPESEIFSLFDTVIYKIIFKASCVIPDYTKALNYGRQLLQRYRVCGETHNEGNLTVTLAKICELQYKYVEARELYENAREIMKKMGDRENEAYTDEKSGIMSYFIGDYDRAREYFEKGLAIRIEIGDKEKQAADYGNLGTVFKSLGEYEKAKEYFQKALAIRIQIGDKSGEASSYGNLGTVFKSLGEYEKAQEYLEKALAIRRRIGDKNGEATSYANLGTVFQSIGDYDRAREYFEKGLAIRIEIGDKEKQAAHYGNLGTVFKSLGEYEKAKEYFQKALATRRQVGDEIGEASSYGNLGALFQSIGEYEKAKEYLEKALAIRRQIGDKQGEATDYGNLGTVFQSIGEYDKAKEYLEKALAIRTQIDDKEGKAADYGNLGGLYQSACKYDMAEGCIREALSLTRDIGDLDKEFTLLCHLTVVKLCQHKIPEALECLFQCMEKSESLRSFLGDNDNFKVSSSDVRNFPYRFLSAFFCFSANPNHALYVLELARARALADLMASQYSVESQISADPQSWIGIENIMRKESNSSCLYISYHDHDLFFWVLKTSGIIHFRRITADEKLVGARLVGNLDHFFAKSFRSFGFLADEDCEDRSLNDVESLSALRLMEEEDEENQNFESSISLHYRMLIGSVADLLEEPDLIVVPDSSLSKIPFTALTDGDGRYLSETFSIRIVPSLTTLRLIQDSPADFHSQSGALVVGDPDVGWVHYRGSKKYITRLPCAQNEAAMIGQLLDVQPLIGQQATKEAVLQEIKTVGLVHFAAHGSAERGEIALSPTREKRGEIAFSPASSTNWIPHEEDYLLTMSDITKVQLRAKLVVLSCCHSARGQIRAEGVIGIARAFLGSGARSVLVALWAIDDKATEQLMRRFYEHLVRGESASESLHQAMKWMRGNGFNEVCDWAPFMLIGDNVAFDFGK